MNPVLELRQCAALTQSLLAAASGVKQATISSYENGHTSPRLVTLERLAAAGGLEVVITFRPLVETDAGVGQGLDA